MTGATAGYTGAAGGAVGGAGAAGAEGIPKTRANERPTFSHSAFIWSMGLSPKTRAIDDQSP